MEKRLKDFFIVGVVLVLLVYSVLFTGILRSVKEDRIVLFAPPNNPSGSCSDSDQGIYPSTPGRMTSDNYNYQRVIEKDDFCLNSTRVVEYSCNPGRSYDYRTYDCPAGCFEGACKTTREIYFLSANFMNDGFFDLVEIKNEVSSNVVCETKVGEYCNLGSIDLLVDEIYIDGSNKWGRFSFGNQGTPFRIVFDDLHNKLTLPLGTELPVRSYMFGISDKDGAGFGGLVQQVNVSWNNGTINIAYGDLLPGKTHNFVFESISNTYLNIKFPTPDGAASVPVLFGNGTDFVGIGKGGSDLLVTSGTNSVFYNQTQNAKNFIVSRSGGGFDSNRGAICIGSVIANVSNCLPGEFRQIYYLSNSSCVTDIPGNITYDRCDYDNNRVIGLLDDINSSFEVSLHDSGGEINISRDFNGTRNLTFNEGSDVRVEFEFDFDDEILDLTRIEMIKQNESDSFGYLIVNGLDLEKAVYLDRIMNDSNAVCVRDRATDEAEDISPGCTGSGEYAVFCDGTLHGDYLCTEEGGDYRVSGISNSGVREFEYFAGNATSCTSFWSCTAWTECSSGLQTRSCSDANSCGTNAGKPLETQICNVQVQSQSCSDQGGEVCANGMVCSVGTTSSRDGECCLGVCQAPEGDSEAYFWLVVGILTLAIIVIIVIIFLSLKNKSMQKGLGEFEVSS